jgi:Uri superfamily endonuclease
MATQNEILFTLDNHRNGLDPAFFELGHPYVYPVDSRINLFRDDTGGRWALAIELLGYNPRAGYITLEITYYGNCLINLEYASNYYSNSYRIFPVSTESFDDTIEGECLKPDAEQWIVRGEKVKLSREKQDYEDASITLKEFEPGEISAEEAARLVVQQYRHLFRATDDELYKSIPRELQKILVIDEWYHRDFYQNSVDLGALAAQVSTESRLNEMFGQQIEQLKAAGLSDEQIKQAFDFQTQDHKRLEQNEKERQSNSPGSYETWQMIAGVLATGDIAIYKPALAPNSHWSNWPDAGSL